MKKGGHASLFLLVMVKKIPIGVYLQFTQLKSIDEKPLPCPVLNQQRELARQRSNQL
jgi:hypothetical protein